MRIIKVLIPFFAVSLFLAACGTASDKDALGEISQIATSTTQAEAEVSDPDLAAAWPDQTAREDAQGAITVVIVPLDLDQPGETIDFDVSMDTHSVDLSMDLTTLATLSTDTGLSVNGLLWTGGRGGHHVQGTLSFPSSENNLDLLDGASELTLVIRDLDAPERIFSWTR